MIKNLVLAILFLISFGPAGNAQVIVHLDVNDVNDVPMLVDWGNQAKELIEQWHQRIANLIPTKGFDVPTEVWLRIRKSNRGVAATSGGRISVSSGWIEGHPEDIGCVHHELVHVIQNYGGRRVPGWITEGIADYLRWAIYEGKPQDWFPLTDRHKGYEASYRVTGGFFLWLESDPAPGIVNKLNTAVRKGAYADESWFEQQTGQKIDELWADYVKYRNERKTQTGATRPQRQARYRYDLSKLKPLASVTMDRKPDKFEGLKMGAPASNDYADINSGNDVVVNYVADSKFARPHMSSGAVKTTLPRLIDGKLAQNNDDTNNNVWYDWREGRFVMDLKKSIPIGLINTYSWHVTNRAPQVFTLWGTNESELPDTTTGLVKDPNWTFIASVDTTPLGQGGVHGSSLKMLSDQPVHFRYLMWVTADVLQGTFFTEIDIHQKK